MSEILQVVFTRRANLRGESRSRAWRSPLPHIPKLIKIGSHGREVLCWGLCMPQWFRFICQTFSFCPLVSKDFYAIRPHCPWQLRETYLLQIWVGWLPLWFSKCCPRISLKLLFGLPLVLKVEAMPSTIPDQRNFTYT